MPVYQKDRMKKVPWVLKVVPGLPGNGKHFLSRANFCLKKTTALMASAFIGVALSASASGNGVDTFVIQGTVNFTATTGASVSNTFGIATGDSFTGTLSYDSSQPPIFPLGSNNPSLAGYQLNGPLISLTVQGHEFDLVASLIFVFSPDSSTFEITTDAGIHADPSTEGESPWGSFTASDEGGTSRGNFTLQNTPGFVLPDSSLPTQLDIADWGGEHRIFLAHDFGASGGVNNGNFSLDAEITSITAAPEPSAAIWLAGMAALVFIARLNKRNRPKA